MGFSGQQLWAAFILVLGIVVDDAIGLVRSNDGFRRHAILDPFDERLAAGSAPVLRRFAARARAGAGRMAVESAIGGDDMVCVLSAGGPM